MSEQKRTGLVLLHGAELGSWIWERVLPLLDRPVSAVDLPGRGSRPADPRSVSMADAIETVVDAAERTGADRVAVVAHSFSGVIVPAVVERLPDRIAAVVFIAATVPEAGKAWVDLLPTTQRIMLRTMYRLRPNGLLSPEGQNRKALCHDLDEEATTAVLQRRVAEVPSLLVEAVPTATLPPGLDRHYVQLTEDQSMTDADQQASIDRLGGQVHRFASGHLPMLSQPAELAALLDAIAASSEVDQDR